MPECDNCGGHVSERFHRVFSNRRGELHGCLECGAVEAGSKRGYEDKENTAVDYGS